MTRLPTPGGDTGNWGTILNEYLSTVHNVDGSLKPGVVAGSHLADGSVTTDKLADASITTTKLASSVQTTLSSVVTTSSLGVAGGIASLDSSGKVPASQLPIASGGTVPVATASVSGTIQLTGDLGGSASSPTVTKLSGVSLSGTPSAGQALVATSSSSAGWQTVSTGGATNPNAGTVWNTTTDPASGSTASSVKDGDMWGDGSTDPTKVLLKARVSGQWVVTAELTKPTVTTTSPPQASVNPTVTDTSVTLSWTAPSQVAGTLDGYNVYEGSSTTPLNTALIPASTTSFTTTTPLTPGTSYNFVIKAVSTPTGGSQTESAGLTIQATTTGTVVNPLPAPTGVTATAGNATASVAFNLVTGATSYTVTATPGGINKIGSTSPITVDGLANGTSYTFTVSATDGTRTSAESTASGAVVPSGVVATLNKVAIIGDSLTEQGGSASETVNQSLKDAGWTDAWYYAKGGKQFVAADGNGKTTMQNIDDCRAEFGEPDLWVIALSTNDYFSTVSNGRTTNQVKADLQTVLTKLGSSAKVAWVNIGFGYEDGGSEALNASLEADVSGRPNTATIDWHQYSRPIVNNMTYWASNDDKVHMTSEGYAMRNTYIAQQSVAAFEAMLGAVNPSPNIFLSGKTVRILPLGDSITDGTNGENGQASGGWRYPLWDKLQNYNSLTVGDVSDQVRGVTPYDANHDRHSGHYGWMLSQLTTLLDTNQNLATYNPDVVLVQAGGNDVNQYHDKVTADVALGRMRTLLNKLYTHNPNMHVFVTTISQLTYGEPKIDQFNQGLPAVVAEYGTAGRNIHFVNLGPLVPATSTNMPDGAHPKPAGYELIAQGWYDAIVAADTP